MKKTPNMLVGNAKPVAVEVKSNYDWKKQRTAFEGCKFGTTNYTNSSTSSYGGGILVRDDSNSDSIGD